MSALLCTGSERPVLPRARLAVWRMISVSCPGVRYQRFEMHEVLLDRLNWRASLPDHGSRQLLALLSQGPQWLSHDNNPESLVPEPVVPYPAHSSGATCCHVRKSSSRRYSDLLPTACGAARAKRTSQHHSYEPSRARPVRHCARSVSDVRRAAPPTHKRRGIQPEPVIVR